MPKSTQLKSSSIRPKMSSKVSQEFNACIEESQAQLSKFKKRNFQSLNRKSDQNLHKKRFMKTNKNQETIRGQKKLKECK